jgi:hypothetical protein
MCKVPKVTGKMKNTVDTRRRPFDGFDPFDEPRAGKLTVGRLRAMARQRRQKMEFASRGFRF